MIRLQGLTLSRGGRVLLDRADANIGPGERIALVPEMDDPKDLMGLLRLPATPDRHSPHQPLATRAAATA